MELHQNDLLYGFAKRLTADNEITGKFIEIVGASNHEVVLARLVSLLSGLEPTGAVECIELTPSGSSRMDARLLSTTGIDGVRKIYYFRIRDAASATLLSILGVTLALCSHTYSAAAIQSTNIAKSLWSHLVALDHQKEGIALEVIEALAAIRAKRIANQSSILRAEEEFPSTKEISLHLSSLAPVDVLAGLKRLESLRLIECKRWGDQAGDLSHEGNRWGERL